MAPKKKETQKMSLGDFMNDQTLGTTSSWADEVEEFTLGTQALPPSDRFSRPSASSTWADRGFSVRDPRDVGPQRIPDKPPYTAHLGNLSYDATNDIIKDFFADCEITTVRIIEDREQMRPKGFAYAEFASADGLKKALALGGQSLEGRMIKVTVAEPPRGDRVERTEFDWTRKGPLQDAPGRMGGGMRGPSDFGERRPPREQADDGKVRDFGTWERKGPLSPLPMERTQSRDGVRSRAGGVEMARGDSYRGNRRDSPAWGEARQEGSRPPRRDMPDRPERVPSAAEKDMQWRTSMRPDPLAKPSPNASRDGSEAPPSPAAGPSPAATPAMRPKLQLAKRTVSEATDLASPASGAESKASPFGGARPIDTATKEREIEEKRVQALKAKKEADDKVKEERRLAREAAAKAEAEAAAAPPAEPAEPANGEAGGPADDTTTPTPPPPAQETRERPDDHEVGQRLIPARLREQRELREPREPREPRDREGAPATKSRATDSGNWRQPSGEHRPPRGPPTGPKRGAGGPPRGGARPPRQNGSTPATPTAQTPVSPSQDADSPAEDGWTTVSKDKRKSQGPRAMGA